MAPLLCVAHLPLLLIRILSAYAVQSATSMANYCVNYLLSDCLPAWSSDRTNFNNKNYSRSFRELCSERKNQTSFERPQRGDYNIVTISDLIAIRLQSKILIPNHSEWFQRDKFRFHWNADFLWPSPVLLQAWYSLVKVLQDSWVKSVWGFLWHPKFRKFRF